MQIPNSLIVHELGHVFALSNCDITLDLSLVLDDDTDKINVVGCGIENLSKLDLGKAAMTGMLTGYFYDYLANGATLNELWDFISDAGGSVAKLGVLQSKHVSVEDIRTYKASGLGDDIGAEIDFALGIAQKYIKSPAVIIEITEKLLAQGFCSLGFKPNDNPPANKEVIH